MRKPKRFVAVLFSLMLSAALASVTIAAPAAIQNTGGSTQQQYGALERGYRTGYSDGYQAGWSDALKGAAASYREREEYRRADRAYVSAYGSLEDYRDGYQQGFESGYETGFARRGFDSSVPPGLARRGATDADAGSVASNEGTRGGRSNDTTRDDESANRNDDDANASASVRAIASDTILRVELLNRLSTDVSQRGDRFEARVIEPHEYEGAVVAGRLSEVQRPGKSRGRAQLQLDFDQIRMPGGDWTDFRAQVIEVVARGDDDTVGDVDPEGGVRGRDSTRDDVAKVGASAGIGAIIGGIAGGGKGAGIGAILGGAAGTAGVLTQRGREIRLERGQQLRIRTTSPVR